MRAGAGQPRIAVRIGQQRQIVAAKHDAQLRVDLDREQQRRPTARGELLGQSFPEFLERVFRVGERHRLPQRIGWTGPDRLAVAALVKSQAPTRLVFLGVLTAQGPQHSAAGGFGQGFSQHAPGTCFLSGAERVLQPFRGFGAAVGEGRFGTDPEGQPAAVEEIVVGLNGLIEGRERGVHGAVTAWEQTSEGLYGIS